MTNLIVHIDCLATLYKLFIMGMRLDIACGDASAPVDNQFFTTHTQPIPGMESYPGCNPARIR